MKAHVIAVVRVGLVIASVGVGFSDGLAPAAFARQVVGVAEDSALKAIERQCVLHLEQAFRIERFGNSLAEKGHDELGSSFKSLAGNMRTAAESIGKYCRDARQAIDAGDRPVFDRMFLRATTEAATWETEWTTKSARAIEKFRATVALQADLANCLAVVQLYIDDVAVIFVDAALRRFLFDAVYKACDDAYSGNVNPENRLLFMSALDALAALAPEYSRRQDWVDNVKQAEGRQSALKSRLGSLDECAPLPEGVEQDLTEYARFVGAQDEDLKRWAEKVALVGSLKEEVRAAVSGAIDATTAARAEATLLRLEQELVSARDPDVVRWREVLSGVAGLPKALIDAVAMFRDGSSVGELRSAAIPCLEKEAASLSNRDARLVASAYLALGYEMLSEDKPKLERVAWLKKARDLLRGANKAMTDADLASDRRLFGVSSRALLVYLDTTVNTRLWSLLKGEASTHGLASQCAERAKNAHEILQTKRFAGERGYGDKTFVQIVAELNAKLAR